MLNIAAIIAVRNGEAYISNILNHFKHNKILFAILDNESTDDTVKIARQRQFTQNLLTIKTIPFNKNFNLHLQLQKKNRVNK